MLSPAKYNTLFYEIWRLVVTTSRRLGRDEGYALIDEL